MVLCKWLDVCSQSCNGLKVNYKTLLAQPEACQVEDGLRYKVTIPSSREPLKGKRSDVCATRLFRRTTESRYKAAFGEFRRFHQLPLSFTMPYRPL